MACSGLRLWTCVALTAMPISLPAQDAAQGGMQLTFGISQTLGATRNPDLDPSNSQISPLSTTDLSLGYLTETRTDRLAIDLTGGLRVDNTGMRAELPTLSFGYGRTSVNADLLLSGVVRRTEANSTLSLANFTALDGIAVLPADMENLNLDGTLTRAQVGGTLTWGKTAPVGYSLGASVVKQHYDGDAAAVRDDSFTTNLDGSVRLDITPVLQANVTLGYTGYDIADSTAPADRVSGSVSLFFDRPAGAISTALNAQETESGTRLGLQAARTFTLPNTSLTMGAGISLAPDGDTQATGRLSYSHTLPQGQVDLAVNSSFVSASDGSERRLTTASASYAMPVTPLSSLQVGFNMAETRDDAGDTALTAALQASQSFLLTPDWALSVGAETELRDETDVNRARRDSLYVSLGRNFTWRP